MGVKVTQIRKFDLEVVNAVVTLRNNSVPWKNVQALLEHMLGRPIWSHEMILAMSVCHKPLREQIPDLSDLAPDTKIEVKTVPGIELNSPSFV